MEKRKQMLVNLFVKQYVRLQNPLYNMKTTINVLNFYDWTILDNCDVSSLNG